MISEKTIVSPINNEKTQLLAASLINFFIDRLIEQSYPNKQNAEKLLHAQNDNACYV